MSELMRLSRGSVAGIKVHTPLSACLRKACDNSRNWVGLSQPSLAMYAESRYIASPVLFQEPAAIAGNSGKLLPETRHVGQLGFRTGFGQWPQLGRRRLPPQVPRCGCEDPGWMFCALATL